MSDAAPDAVVSAVSTGVRLVFGPQQVVALVMHHYGTVDVMEVNNGTVVK